VGGSVGDTGAAAGYGFGVRTRPGYTAAMAPGRIRRYLITGLLIFFPVWLTWVVVKFVFGALSTVSAPVVAPLFNRFREHIGWLGLDWLQGLVGAVLTLLFLYLLGYLGTLLLGRRALEWFDRLMARIPLVESIYGGSKKLLQALQTQPGSSQRVVFIDFPHQGMQAIGLVTRVLRDPATGRELAAVYVPTTPNPTSGYLELVPVEDLTPTDMSMDEAMSFIISGGAIAPDRFALPAVDPMAPPTPPPTP
jgi:uncharacterized membrane protein